MSVNAVDSIGYNPYQYANDQAFWNAYNSYNVNFKGTQGAANTQATVSSTVSTDSASTTASNLPKADYSNNSGISSKGIVAGVVTLGVVGAGLLYASKRGNGKGIKAGLKNIWNGFKGTASKAADDVADAAADTAKDKLNKLKIIYEKGKPKFYVPGKTETITDPTEIANFLKNNKEYVKGLGLRSKTGNIEILDGTFEFVHGGIKNTVRFENGKITGLISENGDDLIKYFNKDGKIADDIPLEQIPFAKDVLKQIAKVQKGELTTAEFKGLKDFRYTKKLGDNILEVYRPNIGANPEYRELTKLATLDKNSEKFKSYLYEMKQQGVDISAITQNIEKGQLPQGFKVSEFTLDFGSGKKILVLDGKPVAMMEGGKTYDLSTDKFKAFLVDTTGSKNNEKLIMDGIEKALKDNKIPEGATIVQV